MPTTLLRAPQTESEVEQISREAWKLDDAVTNYHLQVLETQLKRHKKLKRATDKEKAWNDVLQSARYLWRDLDDRRDRKSTLRNPYLD